MTAETIAVHVIFRAEKGRETDAKKALLQMAENSRNDAGCLHYDMHVNPENPGEFMLFELWESKVLLDEHLAAPHLAESRECMKNLLVRDPEINLWTPLY